MDWSPLVLTFQLATVTTVCLLLLGLPLGYVLSRWRSRWKPLVEALITMPLILPPTVLGFYLLILLSPTSGVGKWLVDAFNLKLVFSFTGIVLGSIIYSLPFMVRPIQSGFSNLPPSLEDAARVLGKSRWERVKSVLLPNIKYSILTGIILTFAHTIGEFGVILMMGGNIPGQTRVASIAIYEEVESLQYDQAHNYALVLFLISFVILLLTFYWNNKTSNVFGR